MRRMVIAVGLTRFGTAGRRLVTFSVLIALGACDGSPGVSLISVAPQAPLTIFTGGTTGPGTSFIVDDGHVYRVRATVTLSPGATFDPADTGVSVIYINPENGQELFDDATESASDPTAYSFDIPESVGLDLCEPMFYRWSAVYDITDGARGVYLGEAQYVMPSQYRPTPNSVAQGLCQTPSATPW